MKKSEYLRNYELEKKYWWFIGVRRIVSNILFTFCSRDSSNTKIGSLLDVGCGTGAFLEEIKNSVESYCGVDVSSDAINYSSERGLSNLHLGDACSLPYKDSNFDIVTGIAIIEHIEDQNKFLREIYRVLNNGGRVLLVSSSFQFLWSMHDVANHHYRRYTLTEFDKLMLANGFKKLHSSHFNFFLFPLLAPMLLIHRIIYGLNETKANRIMPIPPKIVNKILTLILTIESFLITKITLPFGISLVGIYEKE